MSSAVTLDSRINAFRSDLADIALIDVIRADRYTESTLRQCVRGVVPMLAEPALDARQISQVRYGEFLDVFEKRKDGFAWVQNRNDRYVGYIPIEGVLSDEIADLSSRVYTLQTFVYPEADIKSPPIDELTMGSYVRLVRQKGKLAELASGGYVFSKHIAPAKEVETKDYVFTAGRMINTPYLWGGRTPKGLDCSGLVQLALEMAGIDIPRDSDQQRKAFAQPLSIHWHDVPWQRGDIVFFPGHVGIMTNGTDLIHASADEMKVVVEPLYDVVMRGNDVIAAGRP